MISPDFHCTFYSIDTICVYLLNFVSYAGNAVLLKFNIGGKSYEYEWFVSRSDFSWFEACAIATMAPIAAKVLALIQTSDTAVVHEDGHDYVPTNKWVLFGYHFTMVVYAGPLVGPVLAAQFGYLPSMLWIDWRLLGRRGS